MPELPFARKSIICAERKVDIMLFEEVKKTGRGRDACRHEVSQNEPEREERGAHAPEIVFALQRTDAWKLPVSGVVPAFIAACVTM